MLKHAASWRVHWGLLAAITALHGGCKKEEPVPAAAPPSTAPTPAAPAAPVPQEETFALWDVTFRYDAEHSKFILSYKVRNRAPQRERARLCIDYLDKDGYFVQQGNMFDRVSLRPGDSDEVVEAGESFAPDLWNATEVLRFYIDKGACLSSSDKRLSPMLVLAKSGLPVPPDAQPQPKESAADTGEATDPWFRVEGVRLHQNPQGEVRVDYRVTNLTKGRASSQLCVRLANDTRCSCRGIDQAETPTFNLGLGASELRTDRLELANNENWGRGQKLIVYTAPLGCYAPPEQATSNVLILPKPRSIEAPEPPELEEEGEAPWVPPQAPGEQ